MLFFFFLAFSLNDVKHTSTIVVKILFGQTHSEVVEIFDM